MSRNRDLSKTGIIAADSSGNIGIGVSSPLNKLHVETSN